MARPGSHLRDSKTQSKKPSHYENPEFVERAVKAAADYMRDNALCDFLGINATTFVLWKNKAAQGDALAAEFLGKIAAARAEAQRKLVAKVKKAKDWRAAAWLLERQHGFHLRHEVTGKDGVPLTPAVMPPVTVVVTTAPGQTLVNPYALPPEQPPAATPQTEGTGG